MCNRMILSMRAFNDETNLCNMEIPLAMVVPRRSDCDNKSYGARSNL
ncbi:hypothetical protein RSAG8_03608, partial [Rhizoctonia solani AG-8 WAC10335]